MPVHNLHNKPFDEGTQDKLELYREYLREWLPVFIHGPSLNSINVFDFFAGPGFDMDGKPGSPVITCEEIKEALIKNDKKGVTIKVYLNEKDSDKYNSLLHYVEEQKATLPKVSFSTLQKDFHIAFEEWSPDMHGRVANLLFLDQNGVKEISKPIFQSIIRLPKTDFLFFISSAMVNRFKNQPEICERVPVTDEDYSRMNGTNVHRIVADSYRRWIPDGLKYYLGSFSIRKQKGANVYGLVFGSGHPLGIDKFLNVAWKHGGDANFDIDNDKIDPSQPSLFPEMDKPSKISAFEKELESAILCGHLKTNKELYIFSLQNGMLGSHARKAFDLLIKDKKLPKQALHISYDAWKKTDVERVILK
ncbi:MAG: three-Cys-motif partner protein TcmP [Deltaproteobacteria bacterium]|nr:three-Cys-motif partner protein TcmP [Deltaproteobacteria bacterium]